MTNEKILKEEILSEEELENVAGGYGNEIKEDKRFFAERGYLRSADVSDDELKNVFSQFGIGVELHHGYMTANKYYIQGGTYNHNQVWEYIDRWIGRR
ncbi:MAG: hypothetical protein IK062_11660 [Selenomonadaceae bacterium]|nr:hypothetical protein [Selenomonadaceae bacterium]